MVDQFNWVGNMPWWSVILLAIGVFSLLGYQMFWLKRHLATGKSLILTGLRGLVYLAVILFFLQPAVVEKQAKKLRLPLAVLLDTSESMNLPSASNREESRFDLLQQRIFRGPRSLAEQMGPFYDLRWYQFNASLESLSPNELSRLQPEGRGTRLLEALRDALERPPKPAGILLLSDGIANGYPIRKGSLGFAVPVITVGAGDSEGYTDLRISDLRVPEFAFRGRELKVDFMVQAYGLRGKEVPVYFKQGRNLITTQTLNINSDPFEQQVSLTHVPREIGPHSFVVDIPVQTGELIAQNNQKEFKMDVKRDKIRVLTLSGSPSWNYRFIRMALKQDPFIDLISFVFLRTPTDVVDVPENQLSLIPFPTDEIFLEELKNFDLILFDNFSHRSYFNVLYLEKVREFVRDGGGLALIGGNQSFDSGGYGEGPLNDLIPVELNGKEGYQFGKRLGVRLTRAGKSHPITRILPGNRANENAWKKMPHLTSFNPVVRGKGLVLLSVSSGGSREAWPLLAVGKFGKGRTLALMSDDLWRWNFIAVGNNESPQHHLKLMRQAVRWLVQEPTFGQVQILTVGDARTPGEKMELRLRVLKEDFTPASQASVRLQVVTPEGERVPIEGIVEIKKGEYRAEFTPLREGSYRIEAEADLSGKHLGRDRKNFVTAFPYGEKEDGRPRPDLLRQIAEESRGEFIPISKWNDQSIEMIRLNLEKSNPSEILETRQILLWNNLWVLSLVFLLLSAEWWVRRRWGLI